MICSSAEISALSNPLQRVTTKLSPRENAPALRRKSPSAITIPQPSFTSYQHSTTFKHASSTILDGPAEQPTAPTIQVFAALPTLRQCLLQAYHGVPLRHEETYTVL